MLKFWKGALRRVRELRPLANLDDHAIEAGSQGQPRSPSDEAIAVLKQGVTEWNRWIAAKREADLNFRAELFQLDLREREWRKTPLWQESRQEWARSVGLKTESNYLLLYAEGQDGNKDEPIDLRDASLAFAHLEGTFLGNALLNRADLTYAHLEGADLRFAHLEGAHLEAAQLGGARLWAAHFEEADLFAANLEGADLTGANLEGAVLRNANLSNTDVSGLSYRAKGVWPFQRRPMLGHYLGIRGIESCHGSPFFRRDALDQDFIDARFEEARLDWRDPFGSLRRLPARALFAIWSSFDYGRSIFALFIFAVTVVGALGWSFKILAEAGRITFTGNLADGGAHSAVVHALNPWFVAFMGFATLGIADLLRPNHWLGQLAMALDVLSGFVTLGLFIAVFQNKFARRS